jgi:hypothetical protein
MSREMIFAESVRGEDDDAKREIALPGLEGIQSQIAMPILLGDQLLGVLCLESRAPAAFGRVDEDVLSIVVHQLASGIARFSDDRISDVAVAREMETIPASVPLHVRHYTEDDSVFIDNEYLIKGVAGRVLFLLLYAYLHEGRREFTNRELRLDPRLGLPAVKDNLETRLIMLRRRLAERCPAIEMHRVGRGRFELRVTGVVELESG